MRQEMNHFAMKWEPVHQNKMRQEMNHFAMKWEPVHRNKCVKKTKTRYIVAPMVQGTNSASP